jgi:hypothetical protein
MSRVCWWWLTDLSCLTWFEYGRIKMLLVVGRTTQKLVPLQPPIAFWSAVSTCWRSILQGGISLGRTQAESNWETWEHKVFNLEGFRGFLPCALSFFYPSIPSAFALNGDSQQVFGSVYDTKITGFAHGMLRPSMYIVMNLWECWVMKADDCKIYMT